MFAEDGSAAALQAAVAAAEYAATVIASFQPLLIPGFLQTADYARELLSLPGGPMDSGASADEIARRLRPERAAPRSCTNRAGRSPCFSARGRSGTGSHRVR